MTLAEMRQAIKRLLDLRSPADAAAAYYAFHYPETKTSLVSFPHGESLAAGYLCFSRTGLDLFRPLVTMRLPSSPDGTALDLAASREMISDAIPIGQDVILLAPSQYDPLLSATFEVGKRQLLRLLVLDRGRYQPVANVFVQRSESFDGLPRFVINQDSSGRLGFGDDIAAASGINWQSPEFAELYVHTKTEHRRRGLGQSVLAACVQHVLESGQRPLYVTEESNISSIRLAESAGFVTVGVNFIWLEGLRTASP